ncbi:hypothetical protein LAZ67_1002751 [Cordylochernes scorpioides]|uniref:Integrase catalytic domain-containing protein n=1 Tax=Cordylochernes scorpioides TaxID=51811 RepID=A0ABY6JXR3_9ARAC|nr:hypothetical protein LAZ67_1002751 [Cordylochernes scorpioides]
MADQPVSSAELKKLRTPVRARFTKAFNELETEIKKNEVKKADVEKILRRFQTHHEKLSILNMRMEEALLRESASEDILTAEYESVCEYEDNFSNIMTDYEALAEKDDVSTISDTAAMNYQLPKLEFKKFGGEPREWITFWSQFSTIDRDPQMPPETKFQYLFQATAENSEVREAVESFPPSAANYPKVIEYIKSRFGEDEMLVEIYVRDLLQNVRAEGKMSVVKLYDRLETQLRALETLGVARDKFAAMLYPLVESALPEDTLRVWERSQDTVSGRGVQDKLTQLITFLKTEVKGESRVNMAKAAFKIDNNQDAKDDRSNRKSLSKKNTGSKMPTATDLANTTQSANTTQMRNNCIFCGNGHPSQECYSGQRMHLPEKKDKAKGKNVCFWCLLPGHGFKKCRIKPRCPVYGGKHYPIMCPTLEAQKTSHLQKAELKVSGESPATEQETANQFTSTTLNNATVGGVYLQTLIVKISGPKGKHNVRVLLDCGSQRSYISKRMVDALGLKRVQQVTLTHNLFGGGEIRQKKHNVYKVNVSSLNNEYMDDLKFLDQEVICGHISQVQDHTILNELKARGINLTDICQGEEISIHMLIGSDLLSSILTGRMQILQNGVVATETKLGWTVMGPAIGKDMEDSCLIEITTLTKSEDWNHVAGEHNPADLPSRGNERRLAVSKVQYDLEAIEEERRKTVVVGFVAKKPEENPWYLNLYEGKREVTLTQILRVIACMLRFKPSEYKGDIISQEELDSAEKSLVKIIQSESIGEEDPKMKQLHAFQDKEGLWRVKTRIVNRNDDELFRLPILIPTNHPVTELIVKSVHEKMYLCGAQTLRSVLREKFWIPKARQLVRHVIHKCPRCRRFEAKRVDVPEASTFISERWTEGLVRHLHLAVHLELVTSLSTEALVGAVERFVARRGCPAVIYSDNGTNLVGLRNELYRVNFGVKWKLNPPAAPWWGGWIERIVGLTKNLLRRLLGKRVVNYEEMVTILENCERVINARPLTYIAEDNDDLVPLTPEMFLREPRTEGEIDLNEFRCNFGKSYEKRKRLLKEFRKRFRSEYLGLLVHHDNRKKQRQLKVGDIVLVEVENRKQINWPMGKITKVFPGTDNVRRLVEVKTKSGFMKRAVQRLFPLEVPSEDVEQGDGELKPAEDEIVREKTSGVESASVQEKTTPVKEYRHTCLCEDVSNFVFHLCLGLAKTNTDSYCIPGALTGSDGDTFKTFKLAVTWSPGPESLEESAIWMEYLDPVVAAVADEDEALVIHSNTPRELKLPFFRALATEGVHVLSVATPVSAAVHVLYVARISSSVFPVVRPCLRRVRQVFTGGGKFLHEFGTYGTGPGEFDSLAAVAVSKLGHFIVSDRYNHRIQVFDASGRFQRAFGSEGRADGKFNYPWGLATDSLGFIYVCDKENHRIQVFQADGTFVSKFGQAGTRPGCFENPHYVAVSSTNRVVVSDSNNHRVQLFDVNGRLLSTFGSEGSEEGQFKFPRGVAVDDQGFIFVGDSGNNRIQIFHPDGTFLKAFGSWGPGDGEFKGLEGIAVTPAGNILVCDRENHRIQVF